MSYKHAFEMALVWAQGAVCSYDPSAEAGGVKLDATAFLVVDGETHRTTAKAKEHGGVALPMGEDQDGRKGTWWKTALVSTGGRSVCGVWRFSSLYSVVMSI